MRPLPFSGRILLKLLQGICLLFPCVASHAQGLLLQGKVRSQKGEPLSYVTVALLHAADSSVITGAVTDTSGVYRLAGVAPGRYLVSGQLLGYRKAYSKVFTVEKDVRRLQLPPLQLTPATKTLNSLTVTSQRPVIEQKPGMIVVHVNNSIIASGTNILEMLQKLPGVTIDQNGNITLKGKQGVQLLINGRMTHLSGSGLSSLLRGMSADQVTDVQLMDIPPAKYTAAGTGGIININLKKNLQQGFNGSLDLSYGQEKYSRGHIGADLHYKTRKFNVFANYTYLRLTTWYLWHASLFYYSDESYSKLQSMLDEYRTYWKMHLYENDINVGVDYNLTPHQQLTIQLKGHLPVETDYDDKRVILKNAAMQPTSSYHALTTSPYSEQDMTYVLSYDGHLDTLGDELSAELDYAPFKSPGSNYYLTRNYDSSGRPTTVTDQWQPVPMRISIASLQMDYTRNYKKQQAALSAGWKIDKVKTSNQSLLYNKDGTGWKVDPGNTDHFVYNEQVNAAYLNYKRSLKTFSFQGGLRLEQTITRSDQIETDSVVKRNYAQLFPTLFLEESPDKKNSISLSYGRRIDRPNYSQLNPFHSYGDPHQYWEGNPYLQPQVSSNFELSYSHSNWLITSLSYNHIHDLQVITEKVLPGDLSITGVDNLQTERYFAFSTNLSLQPFKWWSINTFLNLCRKQVEGLYVGDQVNTGFTYFSGNMDNEFTMPKGFSAELSGAYHSKTVYGLFTVSGAGYLDAGVKKTFGEGRSTLTAHVNDILHTNRLKMYHQANGTTHYSYVYPNLGAGATRLQITFAWKFGNQKIKEKTHRLGAEKDIDRAGR